MRRRPYLLLILLLVIGAVAWIGLRRRAGDATVVTVEPVRREAVFRSYVTASGEVVATRYADIGSSIMGKIVSLPVAEGDRVEAGQVLARIDPVQARADLDAAQALTRAQESEALAAERQVSAAEADVDLAEARLRGGELVLDRARELHGAGLSSRADLDAAQAAADTAAAQRAAAVAALARARSGLAAARQRSSQARAQAAGTRDLLAKTEITSPIGGVVSRLQVREGEMVVIGIQNQPGTTLMTISDLSSINAEVKVAEADVLRLTIGQPATVELEAIPTRVFRGRVVEIGTSALPVVGTAAAAREFRVVVRLDEADAALLPGLTCDASILVAERTDVLAVPLQAVVIRDLPRSEAPGEGERATASGGAAAAAPGTRDGGSTEQTGVFRIADGRAQFTPVRTGIIGGLQIEVEGIEAGVPVVSGPFQALRDLQPGQRIR